MLKCKCDEFSFEIDTQQIFVKVFEMHQRYSAESMLNSWTLKKMCLGILRLGPRGTFGPHLKYFTQTSLFICYHDFI